MSLLHKKEKQNKNSDPLFRLMTPMIAGVLACVFCLVSMTWAWFTASVDTPTQTFQSATRSTYVKVYEISQSKDANGENIENKTLVTPHKDENKASEVASLTEDAPIDKDVSVVAAGEPLVWELLPEKSYEVIMTGAGTASKGYCEIALSHTASESDKAETKLYTTSAFKKDYQFKFTYNTGGFSEENGVTATEWKEYVDNTELQLEIASCWGETPEHQVSQVSLMSLEDTNEEKVMLLSDGDVVGLAPIPCPEAKAETEVELEGFEVQESAEISAEEDYKVSLTLKEGYEMPSEVVVNIGGKDYVVSTDGAEASDDAPYYDAQSGVLTVPSALLSDGVKVSVKATATPIPEEEPEEEETEEETTEETTEEETEETEETTDDNETEEDNSADTPSDNNVVADNPNKKEENGENDSDEPVKTPTGDGGNDDDDDGADNNSGSSSSGNSSSTGNNKDETEDEKADVKLNLSQLTINLEETQIPTNADLVLTLSAKEDMELPEQIVITLDKTIRDENIEDEEITEDKTEYIINTDGKDNPEGFEFDAESGELTISSELLEGVREITIADTEENEADKDDEKATLTFEVKNLTFDFADDEIVTDEDVVITFTAGEGYELPETIIITIDGEEYIIYTSEEDSDKNPDGITFDIETGTLTISKDLLKDAEAITIAAEGVEKEDEESKEEENPDADKKDESEDKDNTDKENDTEGGETTDKEPEGGTDAPGTEDRTEPEGGTDAPGGENTETTTPETNPDNTTEGEENDDNNGEDNGEDEGETETPEPDTEVTTPTTPDTEDNTNTEQDDENVDTEENGEGSTENGTEETTPDAESGGDDETTTPTEPTTPAEPSEPVVKPETPSTSEPATGKNDDDNGETRSADSSSTESSSNSGNDSTESDVSSESATSTTPSVTPIAPTTSSPTASETSTPSASTPASGNSSSAPASSAPAPSTNSNSNGASQESGTTTPSGNKETSSEE